MALIVLAHPDYERSFANKTIIEALQHHAPDLEIRHLHQLYPDYKIDVKAEQEALLRHRTIVCQYPFYWYNMPAILKHWFDVVFEYQFAYGSRGDRLKGKYFVPSFTVGAPETGYSALGAQHFRIYEFCKNLEQTAYYTQMHYIEPIYIYGTSLTAGYPAAAVKEKAAAHARILIRKLDELEQNT